MSYTKQTWNTGDIITADKLNHMEDGIAGGYDIVFTKTTSQSEGSLPSSVLTADGASFEELLNGGERKASYSQACLYSQSSVFTQSPATPFRPEASVTFHFYYELSEGVIKKITLKSSGTYEITDTSIPSYEADSYGGTYTYSNGHYVFTPSE